MYIYMYIGAQGYGIFVWESASVSLDACCVWELKVGADVSFDAHLDMQQVCTRTHAHTHTHTHTCAI